MELRKADFHFTLSNPDLWQDIKGYEGLYKVSSYGFIYSQLSDKYLSPGISGSNYYTVVLWNKNKEHKTHSVHRLVALHHIPNPENKKCVNHIYGNKLECHKAVLEWTTYKENNDHATRTGLRKVKCTPEVIEKILSLHVKGDINFGAKALAAMFNVNKSTIHDILNKHKKHGTD